MRIIKGILFLACVFFAAYHCTPRIRDFERNDKLYGEGWERREDFWSAIGVMIVFFLMITTNISAMILTVLLCVSALLSMFLKDIINRR